MKYSDFPYKRIDINEEKKRLIEEKRVREELKKKKKEMEKIGLLGILMDIIKERL